MDSEYKRETPDLEESLDRDPNVADHMATDPMGGD